MALAKRGPRRFCFVVRGSYLHLFPMPLTSYTSPQGYACTMENSIERKNRPGTPIRMDISKSSSIYISSTTASSFLAHGAWKYPSRRQWTILSPHHLLLAHRRSISGAVLHSVPSASKVEHSSSKPCPTFPGHRPSA